MQNAQKQIKVAGRDLFARFAVWLNAQTGGRIQPDWVTSISFIAHLPIAVLIWQGDLLLAGLLLIVFGLLDALDGALARAQNSASARGMLFDALTDRLKEVILYTGLVGFFVQTGQDLPAIVAVVACGLSLSVSYVKAKGEAALAAGTKKVDHHTLNRTFDDGLGSFETRISLLVFGLLVALPQYFVAVIAFISLYTVMSRFRAISKVLQS